MIIFNFFMKMLKLKGFNWHFVTCKRSDLCWKMSKAAWMFKISLKGYIWGQRQARSKFDWRLFLHLVTLEIKYEEGSMLAVPESWLILKLDFSWAPNALHKLVVLGMSYDLVSAQMFFGSFSQMEILVAKSWFSSFFGLDWSRQNCYASPAHR